MRSDTFTAGMFTLTAFGSLSVGQSFQPLPLESLFRSRIPVSNANGFVVLGAAAPSGVQRPTAARRRHLL
ncbi:MAG: hypothetical protein LBQ54_06400 [Planctomycetaceae bacterium]|nr:hypothetical protein [Planctomycetaceae bacterium]